MIFPLRLLAELCQKRTNFKGNAANMTHFDELQQVGSQHGGKATGLRRLFELGAKVPTGVALDVRQVERLLAGDSAARDALAGWLAAGSGELAVRSSAHNEDGAGQSFAGMYTTRLNVVRDIAAVLKAIAEVARSGFSETVEAYSGETSQRIPVVLQEMVPSLLAGVAFSHAVLPDGRSGAFIEWVHGLGEQLVSGQVVPATLALPWNPAGDALDWSELTVGRELLHQKHARALGALLERLTGVHGGRWDVEWAIGPAGDFYALQARPATTEVLVPSRLAQGQPLAVSPGLGAGPVRVVDDETHGELQDGEVLVAQITEVGYVPAMKRAAAVVTEEGGLLSHAAIVARELGKPCVVGVASATSLLKAGEQAEVDGTAGVVRQGEVVLGGSQNTGGLNWTSVYVYDRGLEVTIADTVIYVEPTLAGLLAHIDEDVDAKALLVIEAQLRRQYGATPRIVQSDKPVWHREWHRFDRLQSVAHVKAPLQAAVVAWNLERLEEAIAVLKGCALALTPGDSERPLERLVRGELGAALHATVAWLVEGFALWQAYRDTETWRLRHEISFEQFLLLPEGEPRFDARQRAMVQCLQALSGLRNDAYPFFESHQVFDGNYFGAREALIRAACEQLDIPFTDETTSLERLYGMVEVEELDRSWFQRFAVVMTA